MNASGDVPISLRLLIRDIAKAMSFMAVFQMLGLGAGPKTMNGKEIYAKQGSLHQDHAYGWEMFL